MKHIFLLAIILSLLAGCTTPKTVLRNDRLGRSLPAAEAPPALSREASSAITFKSRTMQNAYPITWAKALSEWNQH